MVIAVMWSLVQAVTYPLAAFAEIDSDPTTRLNDPAGLFTEAVITGLGDGTAVSGYDAPEAFDPLTGYPTNIPAGSTAHAVSYAGTIQIVDPEVSTRTGLTYCIDLETDTEIGVNYELGDWTEANVPNMGYIGYILRNHYPATGEPAAAPTVAMRAAAVQAAIWFFSDDYVLAVDSPVRTYTAEIVADALANGPGTEPAEPELTVTPESMAAPATGEIVGPFTVTADGPSAIHLEGVEVFTDPNGTNALAEGATVRPGARLWARSVSDADPQGFVLERAVTALVGTVLLYDGTNPTLENAQKLVLARQTQLTARAGATLEPFEAGRVRVIKHISGKGAGHQGKIVIRVNCQATDAALNRRRTLTVRAGAAAGTVQRTISGLPAGSVCTITEPITGDNKAVNLISQPIITPGTVTVVADETQQVSIIDSYKRACKLVHGPHGYVCK
ncbi:Cys-Gln thioester bond-forming surface protein [Nonomuraea sp. K274]|uniref:Cys-Gln thioester bond-forming surface protein n=1 Tax=Nonomuraea cypriaca TaxID=1187855 RepID=A0A931A913_9ACTN|nr:DUF5979 domain-containing protein [Nonomuraea cypriaca]MBF8185042.1 Cys-Gln thioester bond-forming surface protein [Nonomuraea cypriaca]